MIADLRQPTWLKFRGADRQHQEPSGLPFDRNGGSRIVVNPEGARITVN